MSLISRNAIRTLLQGSQHLARGVHTSNACADKNVGFPPHQINSLQPNASTEGRVKCTLIPGDGVGPELVYSVQEVFKAANIPVDFESFFFSEVNPTLSAPLEDVVNSISRNKICIKGILATPDFSHTGELQTLNMKLRNALDLYANVVHARSLPNIKCRHTDVDCIIIREQTEGEYSALEHEGVPGIVECLKIVTRAKSERIAKFAFDYAVKLGRKKVTCVHKANIMKLGDGLFMRSCQEIAKLYPRIEFETMIVDNCTMQMVSNPNQFDVLVTPNLYGNIVDNLASGLVGGAGVVAGASYSAECAVFEQAGIWPLCYLIVSDEVAEEGASRQDDPQKRGARHIFSGAVGKNIANPTAMLLCSAYMLRHVNLHGYADMVKTAVNKVLTDGKVRTKDLGGQSTTKDMTNAVIHCLTAH